MIRRWAWRLVGRVLAIGADPADSHDVRAQKAFFVGIIVGVLPAGVLWGALYWALGERVAALLHGATRLPPSPASQSSRARRTSPS